MPLTKTLVTSMLLASLPLLATSARQRSEAAELGAVAANGTDTSTGPGTTCCCRIHTQGPEKCSGSARTGARKFWYPAATPTINPQEAPGSHTCFAQTLCCHTFEGGCQTALWGGRYSIANVNPKLCTSLPEVAESLFTATPEEIFNSGKEGSEKDRPAFLGALDRDRKTEGLMARDFTIIVDRSGSMSIKDPITLGPNMAQQMGVQPGEHLVQRWKQVEMAIQALAPKIVEEDPDGVSVFFFDNGFDEYENVKSVSQIGDMFTAQAPGGRTYLAEALKKAMEPDTIGRAETIFVITDGAASDPREVERYIAERSKEICRPELLSISFVQVGSDADAGQYLQGLDDNIEGAKFDIVDAMSMEDMHGKSFLEIVEQSIID